MGTPKKRTPQLPVTHNLDVRFADNKRPTGHGSLTRVTATADMQMLCNIFPILSSQLMKRSSFKQFLILKKNIIYGMTVNGAWSFEQTLNHISTVGSMCNLEAIG